MATIVSVAVAVVLVMVVQGVLHRRNICEPGTNTSRVFDSSFATLKCLLPGPVRTRDFLGMMTKHSIRLR